MAKFQGQVITKQGSNLLARALAGEGKFIFTKAAFGNQKHTEHLEDITNLKSLKLNLNVVKIFNDDGDVVLTLHITNEHLNEGFLTNEFGIFAKLEGDREEILYSYAVAEEPDSIPANTFGTTYETTTEIYMNFASNIETDIYVREGATFLTEPRADEIYVKNEYPVHGNLKSKTQLKADHIYFDDSGNFYLNTGGDRIWNNSATPDIKLVKVTFKTIYTWITNIWADLKTKEPLINKKTAFNLDKTNLTENDSNKLFTAKGALDLFNTLTTNFTNAVNTAKEYFRTELVKKIDKTSKSDSVNSTSSETVATSKAVKAAYDKGVEALNVANTKEPTITKKTAFNLDKTNLTENDSNKLFTAKGALDLFNNLTTAISTAVEAAKTALRLDIAKKIDKTSISDSLTSTSTTTVLSSAGAKALEDNKLTKFYNADYGLGFKIDKSSLSVKNNTLNLGSTYKAYHINYKTPQDSTKIEEFYFNRGDGTTTSRADLYTGTINIKAGSNLQWPQLRLETNDGFWRFEAHPYSNNSGNKRMNLVYNNGSTDTYLSFPNIGNGDIMAYRSWVDSRLANELTTENLNTINTPSISYQRSNDKATPERNYPEQQAGMLLTSLCAYGVIQEYTTFYSNKKYVRGQRERGAWGEWKRIDSLDSAKKLTRVWEGRHIPTVQNNTTPFCTLPEDWSVCFITYEWFNTLVNNKNTFATAVITKDTIKLNRVLADNASTGSSDGSIAEALFYINSNNQVVSLGNQAAGLDCVALMVSCI